MSPYPVTGVEEGQRIEPGSPTKGERHSNCVREPPKQRRTLVGREPTLLSRCCASLPMQLDGRFVSVAGTVADGRVAALLSPAALHAGHQPAGRRAATNHLARRRLLHRLQAKYSSASGSGSSGSVAASLVRTFSQVRRWDQAVPGTFLSRHVYGSTRLSRLT